MTDNKKPQGDGEGKAEGEVSYTVWIDYRPRASGNDMLNRALSDSPEAKLAAALKAVVHATALFQLIGLIGHEVLAHMSAADASIMFENLGELGTGILNQAYSHIEEASDELPSLRKGARDDR